MKQLSILILLTSFISIAAAQSSRNYYELRDRFYQHYEDLRMRDNSISQTEAHGADGLLDKFHRWSYLMQTRLMPDGSLPDPYIVVKEFEKYKKNHPEINSLRNAVWEQVGTLEVPGSGGGAGRVNVVRFDPSNSSVIYLGTAGGGVWKTADGGISWMALTDFDLPVLSIADIAIDPTNTNRIYVATGDGFGYEFGVTDDFWGGVYAAGVILSEDGGNTWTPTGLSYNQSDITIIQRLLINPANPDILIAATRNGIYRTTDGGTIWSQVLATHCYDLEFNSSDPNIIYSGGGNNLYISTDAGLTWSVMKTNAGNDRISIETSDENPLVIYSLSVGGSFVKSTDGGATWTTKSYPSGAGFYGYYDLALTCSDDNSDYLLAGGLYMVKSTNGGTSWQSCASIDFSDPNYIHPDNHSLAFIPGSTVSFLSGNDGGLFKTTNGGSHWTDLSDGMAIAQMYRLSTGVTDPNIIYTGWQDNGSNRWNGNNSTWEHVNGADGMECIVDYTNTNIVYTSYQNGSVFKSIDGGDNFNQLNIPSGGNWITPYILDPVVPATLYFGGSKIYKSTNSGNTWSSISGSFFVGGLNNGCNAIVVAPSNTSTIFAASFTRIARTNDGGSAWANVTGTLPVTNTGINGIAVSNTDHQKVWVCFGGYADGEKIYYSSNGGFTWLNISGSLPNLPVNTIVYENDSPDRLYIGTDVGVYYYDNNTSDWVFYNAGLPNVMIHEIEINYTSDKIVAATFGRGLWQADLVTASAASIVTLPVSQSPLCPNQSVNVDYTANGTFNGGNIFTAQLSDALGIFSSPVSIGSVSSTTSGSIAAFIPASAASGSAYRVRVVSSDPVSTGTDNGSDLTITCPLPANPVSSNITTTSATLSWTGNICAITYKVRYKPVSGGNYTSLKSNSTSKGISGLTPSTQYQWSVKTKCANNPGVFSPFTANSFFTTSGGKMDNLNNETHSFSVYPNPSKGIFEIVLTGQTGSIEIFNVLGQQVWNREAVTSDENVIVNLSTRTGGIYFVTVNMENQVITKQITIE